MEHAWKSVPSSGQGPPGSVLLPHSAWRISELVWTVTAEPWTAVERAAATVAPGVLYYPTARSQRLAHEVSLNYFGSARSWDFSSGTLSLVRCCHRASKALLVVSCCAFMTAVPSLNTTDRMTTTGAPSKDVATNKKPHTQVDISPPWPPFPSPVLSRSARGVSVRVSCS